MNVFPHQFSEMVLKILIDSPFNNLIFLVAQEIFYCILSPWKLRIICALFYLGYQLEKVLGFLVIFVID